MSAVNLACPSTPPTPPNHGKRTLTFASPVSTTSHKKVRVPPTPGKHRLPLSPIQPSSITFRSPDPAKAVQVNTIATTTFGFPTSSASVRDWIADAVRPLPTNTAVEEEVDDSKENVPPLSYLLPDLNAFRAPGSPEPTSRDLKKTPLTPVKGGNSYDVSTNADPVIQIANTFSLNMSGRRFVPCGTGDKMAAYRVASGWRFIPEIPNETIVFKVINRTQLEKLTSKKQASLLVASIEQDLLQYDAMVAARISVATIYNRKTALNDGYVIQQYIPYGLDKDVLLWNNKPNVKLTDITDGYVQDRLEQLKKIIVDAVRAGISIDARPANFRFDENNRVYCCDPGQDWGDDTPLFYAAEGIRFLAKGSLINHDPVNVNVGNYLIAPLKATHLAEYTYIQQIVSAL